jgi:type I restriction enzyme S subunit
MKAERLLAHYERIADAPDAITRLRRFILDLAVRGKLVPQDAADEPASELLKRIAKEKARLAKAGEIRKPPTFEPITDAEALYALPRTWAWVRVGDIFDYDAGTKRDPKELDQSRWLLELEDIEKDTSRIVARLRVSDRDSQSTKSEFEPGDILYGKLRPYLNKVVVADEPGYSTTEIVAIRPLLRLCPEYCALAFRRPDFVAYVERLGRGTKMPRLRTPDAIVAPFPLPPLAEQHRIVAKVDELMGLCDRLEAARAGREAARDRLAAASLARLNAPDPETFQADARFALDALPALTTRPDQIRLLRQTILNLAVRGKLVPQDAADEPASELLKRIAKEKARLAKAGEIRKPPTFEPITDAEALYALPRTWAWVRVGDIFDYDAGTKRDPKELDQSRWLLELEDIEKDTSRIVARLRVSDRDSQSTKSEFEPGDILYGKLRPYLNKVVVADEPGYSTTEIVAIRPLLRLCPEYCALAFRRPDFVAYVERLGRGTKMPRLRTPDAIVAPFPLPPLAEQHRIVAKVDALMALCDRLEASVAATAATRRRLLDALLAEALAPADDREREAAE